MRKSNMLLKVCIKYLAAGPLAVCVVIGDASAWKHIRISHLMLKLISSDVPPGSPVVLQCERWILACSQEFGPKGIWGEDRARSFSKAKWGHSSLVCVGPSPSCFIKAAERRSRDGAFAVDSTGATRGQTQELSSSWGSNTSHMMLSNDVPARLRLWTLECLRSLFELWHTGVRFVWLLL